MESNSVSAEPVTAVPGTGDTRLGTSAADASRSLAEVAADQVATRLAAAPPKWMTLGMSICWGCTFALPAIPDPRGSLRLLLFSTLTIIEMFLVMLWARHKRVHLGREGTLVPFRPAVLALVLMIIIFIVFTMTSLTPLAHHLLPWWFYPGLGVLMGCLMYASLRWIWRSWARRAS